MATNPLRQLEKYGQSIWLDFLSRDIIQSGKLQKLIEEDGVKGVTSNPAIFKEAISGSDVYSEDIRNLAREGMTAAEIYEVLTVADIQAATDLLRPVYDRLDGKDGFVSLEVNPHLARDTEGTNEEARRLWGKVDRPNAFIKVPATREGLLSIRRLISEGMNINVTLLFGLPRYREVAEAYIAGLEDRAAQGQPLEHIASVASFFLSRIDVLLDPQLEGMASGGGEGAEKARALIGEVAIASAKIAYQMYQEIFASERFRALAVKGARPQRVLWASTSTKNPAYLDVKYVEALIGPNTVNTLPEKTIEAYRDHGDPKPRLEEGLEEAGQHLQDLSGLGIDLDEATQQLEDEGVEKFNQPYDELLQQLEDERKKAG